MARLILRPSFSRDLDALKRNHRHNYRKASEILIDLQRDGDVSAGRRPDSRIPGCVKFELSDGYRIVLQQVSGADSLVALAVGKHDHVDTFLDGHRGHLFDPDTGRMKELRIASRDEVATNIVSSLGASVKSKARRDESVFEHEGPAAKTGPLFAAFTDEILRRLGLSESHLAKLRRIEDENSLDCTLLLEEIDDVSRRLADLLLAYATGNAETRESVLDVARGRLEYREQLAQSDLEALNQSPEEFLTLDDPTELEEILERSTFEQWQLFLHPAQKSLVNRKFEGPARIRGISGSGKTVVALHHARRLAREFFGTNFKILFTTHNKELARSAASLLDSLCGKERALIEVVHLHRWCLDYIFDSGRPRPRFDPGDKNGARDVAWRRLNPAETRLLEIMPREYVWSEIDFIFGRFLHEETEGYRDTDRAGRGRLLTQGQRQAFLELYRHYFKELSIRGVVDPQDFVREAYRLLASGQAPEDKYAAVIVDEVQDLSEISLKLLHSLIKEHSGRLLLVGDNTQRIFTRGFSMRGLGIDITGRSVILRKNYRNTHQILEAAFPLVANEWENDVKAVGVDPVEARPEFSARDGSKPIIVHCDTVDVEIGFVVREVRFLLNYDSYKLADICIMSWGAYFRNRAIDALHKAGIPVVDYHPFSTEDRDDQREGVRVCSLHAAKGHEYGAVLVVGCVEGVLPPRSLSTSDGLAEARAVLYVGMTRARDLLYLSYSDTGTDGRTQLRSTLVTEVAPKCDAFKFRRKLAGN